MKRAKNPFGLTPLEAEALDVVRETGGVAAAAKVLRIGGRDPANVIKQRRHRAKIKLEMAEQKLPPDLRKAGVYGRIGRVKRLDSCAA